MKNIIILMLVAIPLVGCTASIGPNPSTKSTTTYSTPTKYSSSNTATKTTVTQTSY